MKNKKEFKLFNKSVLIILSGIALYASEVCINTNIKKITPELVKTKKQIIPNGKYYTDDSVKKVIKKEKFFANAFIKQFGIDEKTKKALTLSAYETLTELYRNKLKEKYAPDEKTIKSFYIDHKDEFQPETKVSISTITLASLKKADEIYAKLKKHPEKFDELAKKYSIDSNIKYKDVELSKFAYPVREWIRKAKKGEISEPVKVGKYYFIDRLENKKERGVSYEELKPFIKEILVNIYINNLMKKQYEEAQ